ncbi:desmoglein-2-like, partial [Clarias magur]
KARFLADNPDLNESLLMYNDEGQYSSVGSLESCCILEAENDLGFLKDLDYKFGNLATVCSPPSPQPKFEEVEEEQIAESVDTRIK